jgi:predicted DNA-binding ribbon-helix-helix protein
MTQLENCFFSAAKQIAERTHATLGSYPQRLKPSLKTGLLSQR